MNRESDSRGELLFSGFCFLLTIVLAAIAAFQLSKDPLFRTMMKLSLQAELLAHHYVGEVSAEDLFRSAWQGMQREIPYTVALSLLDDSGARSDNGRNLGLRLIPGDALNIVYSVRVDSPLAGTFCPGDSLIVLGESDSDPTTLPARLSLPGEDSVAIEVRRFGAIDTVTIHPSLLTEVDDVVVDRYHDVIYIAPSRLSTGVSREIAEHLTKVLSPTAKGLLVDLRSHESGVRMEAYLLADLLLGRDGLGLLNEEQLQILAEEPLQVLIDGSTSREFEKVARLLADDSQVTTIGRPTLGLPIPDQPVKLWSGDTLFVSEDRLRQKEALPVSDSAALAVLFHRYMLQPDIPVESSRRSPLVADLIGRNVIFDFVLNSGYDSLPTPQQEGDLLRAFLDFLSHRDYYFEPLHYAVADLATHELSPEMRATIERIKRKADRLGYGNPQRFATEITGELLKAIQEIRVGRLPELEQRLRFHDESLTEAVKLLNHEHPPPE